jgi:hypothetical protein
MTTITQRHSRLRRRHRMGDDLSALGRLATRAERASQRCIAAIDACLRSVQASEARIRALAATAGRGLAR